MAGENFPSDNSDVLQNYDNPQGILGHITKYAMLAIHRPVAFYRNIVDPIQKKNKKLYYHRKYNRVPTVDECFVDDAACIYEAKLQLHRDRLVDMRIMTLLNMRRDECLLYYKDEPDRCESLTKTIHENGTNFFIKYGELRADVGPTALYMKQKHRIAWERRHGKVGEGMKREAPLTFEFDPVPYTHNLANRDSNNDVVYKE